MGRPEKASWTSNWALSPSRHENKLGALGRCSQSITRSDRMQTRGEYNGPPCANSQQGAHLQLMTHSTDRVFQLPHQRAQLGARFAAGRLPLQSGRQRPGLRIPQRLQSLH